MTLRLHPQHNIDTYLDATNIKIAPQARLLNQAVNVYHIQDFDKGSCFVQDASAQLAAPLLNPINDDLILDACCAPGGKTTHLSELAPHSKIIALDSDTDRLKRVQENIERLSIKNIGSFKSWVGNPIKITLYHTLKRTVKDARSIHPSTRYKFSLVY